MHALNFNYTKKMKYAAIANILAFSLLVYLMFSTYQNSAGSYSKEINTIFIYPKDNSVFTQFYSASHEIGHYIYFKKLSDSDRKEYEKIFKDSNRFITEYSKTNAAENFAEEFAAITILNIEKEYIANDRNDFFISKWNKMFNLEGDING